MRDIEQDRIMDAEKVADLMAWGVKYDDGMVIRACESHEALRAEVERLRAKVEELEVQVSTEGVRLSEREGEGNTVTFDRTAFTQFFNNHMALVKRAVKLKSELDTLRAEVERLKAPLNAERMLSNPEHLDP